MCESSARVKIRVARRASGRSVLTQGPRVEGGGGGISIRLKWTVILMTTRGCCPADNQPQLGRPHAVRRKSPLEAQMFQCESSTLGWMILLRTQNLLPLCLSRLRVCWMHWSKICTQFHEVFGVDGSNCIGELHRFGIDKHVGLSIWCAIWHRGLVQFRRCGSSQSGAAATMVTVERPVDVGTCKHRRHHSHDGVVDGHHDSH